MSSRYENSSRREPGHDEPARNREHSSAKTKSSRSQLTDFFIKGDGINREVLQREIARYLGPDAYSQPSTYNGNKGYNITAVEPLTSEMLNELVELSASYQEENREKKRKNEPTVSYGDSATARLQNAMSGHQEPPSYIPHPYVAPGPYTAAITHPGHLPYDSAMPSSTLSRTRGAPRAAMPYDGIEREDDARFYDGRNQRDGTTDERRRKGREWEIDGEIQGAERRDPVSFEPRGNPRSLHRKSLVNRDMSSAYDYSSMEPYDRNFSYNSSNMTGNYPDMTEYQPARGYAVGPGRSTNPPSCGLSSDPYQSTDSRTPYGDQRAPYGMVSPGVPGPNQGRRYSQHGSLQSAYLPRDDTYRHDPHPDDRRRR